MKMLNLSSHLRENDYEIENSIFKQIRNSDFKRKT